MITTKKKEFAVRLIARAGIILGDEFVFGLSSESKSQTLARLSRNAGGRPFIFVEDRIDTLRIVRTNCSTFSVRNALATWGYNTPRQVATLLQEDPMATILDATSFRAFLEPHIGKLKETEATNVEGVHDAAKKSRTV